MPSKPQQQEVSNSTAYKCVQQEVTKMWPKPCSYWASFHFSFVKHHIFSINMCKFARNLSLSHYSVLVLVLRCLFSSISSPLVEDGFAVSNNALGRAILVLPFGASDGHPDAPFADAVLRLGFVLVFRHSADHSCCCLSFVRRHIASAESGQQNCLTC
jgi:hypothetical protein